MPETTLLPCPHCGGSNISGSHIRDGRSVGCRDCGASVRAFQPNAEADARAAWNRRTAHSSGVMVKECATEGCGKPATVHFERGGIGSYYCRDCYMRIQSIPSVLSPAEPGVEGDAKPVAWLVEGCGWKRVFLDREAAQRLANLDHGEFSPLFTHPSLLEECREVLEWRGMDSAPKDGTSILYCTKFLDIGFCHWDEGYNEDEMPCWWDNERDDEACPIAWLPADTLPPVRTLLSKLEAGTHGN